MDAVDKVLETLEHARKKGWLERILDLFRSEPRIVLVGCSGAGKTQLLHSLRTHTPRAIDRLNRTQFAQEHAISLGNVEYVTCDTPGHPSKFRERVAAINDACNHGPCGVVVVAAFGYHEYEFHGGMTQAVEPTLGGKAADTWLEYHRAAETKHLEEIAPHLSAQNRVRWIVTCITKADAWWTHRNQVVTHYANSDYARVASGCGKPSHTLLYCSRIQRFFGTASLDPEFDENEKDRLREEFIGQTLTQLMKGLEGR